MPNIITLRPIALDTTDHGSRAAIRRLTLTLSRGQSADSVSERPLQMSDAQAIRVGRMPSAFHEAPTVGKPDREWVAQVPVSVSISRFREVFDAGSNSRMRRIDAGGWLCERREANSANRRPGATVRSSAKRLGQWRLGTQAEVESCHDTGISSCDIGVSTRRARVRLKPHQPPLLSSACSDEPLLLPLSFSISLGVSGNGVWSIR